jgi:hypothetical protein
MQTLDPAGEWLRLSEHYRQLSDDELVGLGRQTSELTDVAQPALTQEIANRRLKIPPEESAAPTNPEPQQTPPRMVSRLMPKTVNWLASVPCGVWGMP